MNNPIFASVWVVFMLLSGVGRASEQRPYSFFPFCIDWHDAKKHLCHWLRVDKGRDYKTLLQQAMPRLWAVSINGADNLDENPGWSRYIQPLNQGSFDVGRFLKTLKQLGYRGPIGLQCYGIGGDAREHLANSMSAWKKLSENLKN